MNTTLSDYLKKIPPDTCFYRYERYSSRPQLKDKGQSSSMEKFIEEYSIDSSRIILMKTVTMGTRTNSLWDNLKDDSIIICTEMSRISRSLVDFLNLISDFKKRGISIIFTYDLVNSILLSKNSKGERVEEINPNLNLILGIKGLILQYQREFIKKRTEEGLKAWQARLGVVGLKEFYKNRTPRSTDLNKILGTEDLKFIENKLKEGVTKIYLYNHHYKNRMCLAKFSKQLLKANLRSYRS